MVSADADGVCGAGQLQDGGRPRDGGKIPNKQFGGLIIHFVAEDKEETIGLAGACWFMRNVASLLFRQNKRLTASLINTAQTSERKTCLGEIFFAGKNFERAKCA